MPTVFIIGQDWRLRANVRAELRGLGVEALGFESLSEAVKFNGSGTCPAALVVEGLPEYLSDPAFLSLAKMVPALVITSQQVSVDIPQQAAAVLQRPVTVDEIVQRVGKLIQGQAV